MSKPGNKRVAGISLGPEIISDFQRRRRAEGRLWAAGYTVGELDAAQERYGLVFPPDLIDLFLDRRPVLGWDWRSDDAEIREMLARPFEGLLFEVEHGLWLPAWGSWPNAAADREATLREIVRAAPKLIPLYSHRYIPSEPAEVDNPVFSIVQADIVHYGFNLEDYFEREFGQDKSPVAQRPKIIRFWSDFIEFRYQPPFYLPGRTE